MDTMIIKKDLYPFYKANIAEDRCAARIARAFPLVFFATICSLVCYGVVRNNLVLLVLCAVMNVALWLWLVTTCIFGVLGTFLVQRELEKVREIEATKAETNDEAQTDGIDSVVHMVVLPNYKEDECLLDETLQSLSEADDSQAFHIVLAMEAREQDSDIKGASLKAKYEDRFARIVVSLHPADLEQDHNDGTIAGEVPGKASNLRWAVGEAYKNMTLEGEYNLKSVMVTVADADCIIHPAYFAHISREFNAMRETPGEEQDWTMWQAPQLSFRNHWAAPVCSRTWSYISSMYEFGGVSGLHFGGHHMVFSAYTLPLQLAHQSECWDGDIIAEDHHCYLKNFFYSVYASATSDLTRGCQPKIQVKPVFLPVKSSPIISPHGYWSSYVERWHQAKRHAQGLAELSYALLASYDALCSLPIQSYSFSLFYGWGKVLTRLMCMHLLPICQSVGLAVMTLFWLYNKANIPGCSQVLHFSMEFGGEYVLCGLAGTWTLVWPVVVPIACLIVANYFFASAAFISPAHHSSKLWYKEDGDFAQWCCSKKCAAFFSTVFDCVVCLMPMMLPYGLIAMLVAMWNVALYGNEITYISAAKQTKATDKAIGYGSMNDKGDNAA